MGGDGSGRKPGVSYPRRTKDEIERDEREENQREKKRQRTGQDASTFFAPRQPPTQSSNSNTSNTADGESSATTQPSKGPSGRADIFKCPDLSQIPQPFQEDVKIALEKLWAPLRAQGAAMNQHTVNQYSSRSFAWSNDEVQWPDPLRIAGQVCLVDFLKPYFCRMKYFSPDRSYGHLLDNGKMPCKWCRNNNCVKRDSIFAGFKFCIDVDGSVIHQFYSNYRCERRQGKIMRKRRAAGLEERIGLVEHYDGDLSDDDEDDVDINDTYYFTAICPEVLAKLPALVLSRLGMVLKRKRGMTDELLNSVVDHAISKQSFTSMSDNLKSKQVHAFRKRLRDFKQLRHHNATVIRTICGNASNKHSNLCYDEVSGIGVPSRQWLQGCFVGRALDLLDYIERFIQMLGGKVLRADRSYKVIKFIFTAANSATSDNSSFRAFDSVYTVMNEHGMIIAIHFVRSGAAEEIEKILSSINARYKIHGFDEVELFYTDNCCSEYNMLTRAIPPLGKDDEMPARTTGDSNTSLPREVVAPLPLPDTWDQKVVKDYDGLVQACRAYLKTVMDNPQRLFFVGFDTEHDSFTAEEKARQYPETVQLADYQEEFVVVFRPSAVFKSPVRAINKGDAKVDSFDILKQLFELPNVVLCGNSVKSDMKKLCKYFPAELFGANTSFMADRKKFFDPNVAGRANQVIQPGRGNGTLKTLTLRFSGFSLTDHARSIWSAVRLRRDLKEYAARDAYASSLVGQKVHELCKIHRFPKRSDLQNGTPVRLLGSNSKEIGGFGRIAKIDQLTKQIFVKIEVVRKPSMTLIPKNVNDVAATTKMMQDVNSNEHVFWVIERMRLSSEAEIEEAQAHSRKVDEERNRQVLADAAQANVPQGDGSSAEREQSSHDSNALSGIELPEGTSIDYYPAVHIHDDNDENDSSGGPAHESLTHEHNNFESYLRNHVKADAFHVINAYKKTLKKRHGVYLAFSGAIRDAMFMVNSEERDKICKKLTTELFHDKQSRFYQDRVGAESEARRRLLCPSSKLLDGVPRTIPKPSVLCQRINDVVSLFSSAIDAKTGDVFFSRETWKVHKSALQHVKKGCLSDIPGYQYYYTVTNSSGKSTTYCIRSTSQLEGFHRHLRQLFPSFFTSPMLAVSLLALFVYKWNIDRMVERGLLHEGLQYDCFNHDILRELQTLNRHECNREDVDESHELPNPSDFYNTREKFFTPIMKGLDFDKDDYDEPDLVGQAPLSESQKFSAERDGNYGMPVTGVLPFEHPKILDLLCRHTRCGRNQQPSLRYSSSIDFESATEEWNSLCMQEFAKPLSDRQMIFPKTASLLKTFHSRHLQKQNQQLTMRQIVMRRNQGSNGVQSSVVLRRGLREVQHQLAAQSTNEAVPVQNGAPPLACLQVVPDAGDPVVVPPSELNNVRNNQLVMGALARQERLQGPLLSATTAQAVPPAKHCCMRCGNVKSGEHHQGGPTNSKSYCTVPCSMRHPHWPALKGYQVGDSLQTRVTARQIKILWKEIKREKGVADIVSFRGW